MITPRSTRLFRVPDLAGFRAQLVAVAGALDRAAAPHTFILVPTQAAAAQLRRTLVDRSGSDGQSDSLPLIGSRIDLYEELIARADHAARLLTDFDREAIMAAAGRDAEEAGVLPPFHVRPGLVAEMLSLYDRTRRLHRTVADFERLVIGELQDAAESDRGAAQLLEQTHFLVAAFRGYEHRLEEGRSEDEHVARQRLIEAHAQNPLRHLVVTVADWRCDPHGLWPADEILLAAVPGLQRIDFVATEAILDAGYRERLARSFIEIGEEGGIGPRRESPTLVVPDVPPSEEPRFSFTYRDREDELEGVARRITIDQRAGRDVRLEKTALIVARPLPYLYLAREVFGSASIAFAAPDTLPLAAEPYAAAVDVALEFVAANFTRRATIALLGSPHFQFADDGQYVRAASISALDRVMADQRYLGGIDRLLSFTDSWTGPERAAAVAARAAARELSPLAESRPLVDQFDLLRSFLDRHDRPVRRGPGEGGEVPGLVTEVGERRERVKRAVRLALDRLCDAYRRHDPSALGTIVDVSGAFRRRLGAQTFSLRTGTAGLQILDPHAARYGDFDDLQLMGLVDGEWPERERRNIFFPPALLAELEPARPERIQVSQERDAMRFARAAFRDLVGSAAARVRVSTFSLESDSVVEPSPLVDDLALIGLIRRKFPRDPTRPRSRTRSWPRDPCRWKRSALRQRVGRAPALPAVEAIARVSKARPVTGSFRA